MVLIVVVIILEGGFGGLEEIFFVEGFELYDLCKLFGGNINKLFEVLLYLLNVFVMGLG